MNPDKQKKELKKPKSFKDGMKKLAIYCKPFWAKILIAIMFACIGAVLTVIGPNIIGDLTDEIMKAIPLPTMTPAEIMALKVDLDAVFNYGIWLVVIYLTSVIFSYLQGFIMANITQKISKKLRNEISTKIDKVPLKYIDKRSDGDILSRITNDVDNIGQTLNNNISALIAAFVLLIGVIIMMFVTNWILALSAIGASLVGFVLIGVVMMKSQKYFEKQRVGLGDMSSHVEEYYTGHSLVKISNAERKNQKIFNKINKELTSNTFKSQFYSGLMMPLMTFVGNLGYVIVCVVGAILVSNGTIGIGVIVSFMIYIRLFTQPLGTIAQGLTSMQSTAASSERVFEFLDEQEMEKQDELKQLLLNEIKGNVEFNDVVFGYDDKKNVINNFNAKIKKGQKVAIVGPTGGGKTTIVNLLMKFYEIQSGDILIDGKSIHELTRESVHSMFGMVLQDTWIFGGTIKQNLVYNNTKIKDEKIKSTCQEIGIDHFISTLKDGYETYIDENVALSQGQKQLITIARAMLQNSPMLILDEATSSVDTRTEIQIQKAMDKLMEGRTSFVIAHRLSTIKNADLILVLKDGCVIEQGNHDDLLKDKGFYSTLYNSQFEN